jgi:TonB family protein
MKHFQYILLFLFTCSKFSQAQVMHVDTLALKLYVNYELDAAGNKSGKYEMVYKNKVLSKGNYKDNLRDGSWEFRGMNDTLQQKGNYVKGMKDGVWESYYSDGKLSCTMPYKNGNKEGTFVGKYRNGRSSFEKKYVADNAEGPAVEYYENGSVSDMETYRGDTLYGPAKRFYENNVLKEERFMKGNKRDSVYKFYYEDGSLWEHIIYKNGSPYNVIAYNAADGKALNCCTLKDGTGVMRFYDKQGRVSDEDTYLNSVKNGKSLEYKDGILIEEGNYKDGKSEGLWISHYETGEVYSKINYSKGEEQGEALYYNRYGKLSQQGTFENGKRKGLWKTYAEDGGELSSEITYLNDMYEGDARYYNKGKIVSEGKYSKGERVLDWKYYDPRGKLKYSSDYGYSFDAKEEMHSSYDAPAVKNGETVYAIIEQMPMFPGGESMMMEFIQKNINYPREAREGGFSGTVYINFVVENTGEISKVRVLRGAQKQLNEESMRIVKSMPRWSPGLQSGRPVAVSFNLPIKYTLK